MLERAGVTETQEGSEECLPLRELVLEALLCQRTLPLKVTMQLPVATAETRWICAWNSGEFLNNK